MFKTYITDLTHTKTVRKHLHRMTNLISKLKLMQLTTYIKN